MFQIELASTSAQNPDLSQPDEKRWEAFPKSGLAKPNVCPLYGGGFYDGTKQSIRSYAGSILTPTEKGFIRTDQDAVTEHFMRLLSSDDPRLLVEANNNLPRYLEDPTIFHAPYFHFLSPRREATLPLAGLEGFGFARLTHGMAGHYDREGSTEQFKFLGIETIQGAAHARRIPLKVEPTSKTFILEWILRSAAPLVEAGWTVGLSCNGYNGKLANSTPYFDTKIERELYVTPSAPSTSFCPWGRTNGKYLFLKDPLNCTELCELFRSDFPKG